MESLLESTTSSSINNTMKDLLQTKIYCRCSLTTSQEEALPLQYSCWSLTSQKVRGASMTYRVGLMIGEHQRQNRYEFFIRLYSGVSSNGNWGRCLMPCGAENPNISRLCTFVSNISTWGRFLYHTTVQITVPEC